MKFFRSTLFSYVFLLLAGWLTFSSAAGVLEAYGAQAKKSKNKAYQLIKSDEKIMVCVYYADKDHGQRTASGEFYDKARFTAAHKTLPFGTKLKVRNLKTNKVIEVIVNDRVLKSRKHDLVIAYAAAEQLNVVKQGVMKTGVAVVGRDMRYKKYIRSGVLDAPATAQPDAHKAAKTTSLQH